MRIVESVLPSLPKRPHVILSANDDMALGAIEALQSQGVKPGEILVTGFDAVPEALARVRDGWLAVTADQRPGFAVQTAMSQLVACSRLSVSVRPVTDLSAAAAGAAAHSKGGADRCRNPY